MVETKEYLMTDFTYLSVNSFWKSLLLLLSPAGVAKEDHLPPARPIPSILFHHTNISL